MGASFYGLKFDPFGRREQTKVKPFLSGDYMEAYGRLSYLKENGGIAVLTSSPGMGKTRCLQSFAESLDTSKYCMKYISLTTVSVSDFYRQISVATGGTGIGRKARLFKEIQDNIWNMYSERNCTMVLAIDDAQYLSPAILRDLKILMNFRFDSVSCFALVLCGEKKLNRILAQTEYECLRQRISVHYRFRGLGINELPGYVCKKIETAGGEKTILDESAIPALHQVTNGIPRMVDNVMSYALMLGNQTQTPYIDKGLIEKSGAEVALDLADD